MIDNEHINKAITYILNNITENITVDDVAKHCNFSKYYFSRLFKESTGESIYGFIKRVKLEQSAFRLKVEKDRSITDVSCDYGYTSSNYSSAFKLHHDVSPVKFRNDIPKKITKNVIFNNSHFQFPSYAECNKNISIETIKDVKVIYERHIGSYINLSNDWCNFQSKYKDYITANTLLIERTFDDPSITNIDECLYDICISVNSDCKLENTYILQGGKFAVYHFKGKVKDIFFAYQTIFNVWLPQSLYRIDRRYSFEIYRKIDSDNSYMEIDIFIPVEQSTN